MEDDDSKFYSGSLTAPEDSSSNHHDILNGSSLSSSSADFSYNHFNERKQSSQTNSTKHDTSSDYEASGIDEDNYKYQTKNYNNLASSSQDDEDDDDDDDIVDKVDDQNEDENEDKDDESEDEDSDDADGDDNNDNDDNDDADVDEEDNGDTKDRDMSSCWETKSNGSIEYDIQYPVNNDSINNENIEEDNDDNSNDNMQTITESLLNEKIKSIEEREKINENKNKNLNTTTDNNSEINEENNNYQNLSPNRNPMVVNKAASPQPGCSKDFDTMEKKFNESNNNNNTSITATTTTIGDEVTRDDADHLSHIQRDTNVILNIIGKLTFNSICNGLMHLSDEDRKRCINTLKKLSPFYVQKGVKRLRASDNCDLVSNKKVDDKIYPVETTNNKMNFPGRSYSPLPSEVEVIEYDDHEERVSYQRDTIDITSSDDESSTKKKNNKVIYLSKY